METTAEGTATADLRDLDADMLHALGGRYGADLGECPDKLGFFAAIAASLARADQLSQADRARHAAALFDMIVTMADEADPGFVAGWNTALSAQTIMMKADVRAEGGLSEAGYERVKQTAAELWRTAAEDAAG
jgi:hypothetical protein